MRSMLSSERRKFRFLFFTKKYISTINNEKCDRPLLTTEENCFFSLRTKKMPISEYKLCVFGSGGVGKSCLVRQRELNQ